MVVRELITKISFAVNRGGLDAANNGISRLKRILGGIGGASSMASRMFGNSAANMAASATKAEMGISRIKASVNSLTGALGPLAGAMVAAFSISAIKDTADEMMNLDGRLRTITDSDEQRYGVEEKLYALSQRNRQALSSMGDLYYKVARSAKHFGVSEEDSMRVTDIVSRALTVGGASANEASSAILQLGQALGSGVLQGDELSSLDDNASLLMQHIAENMGVTIGDLKKMGSEGKLTSAAVIDAILKSGTAIDAEFDKMPTTIGQAETEIKNSWDMLILHISRSTGVFSKIAKSIEQTFEGVFNDLEDFVSILNYIGHESDSEIDIKGLEEAHPILTGIASVLQQIYGIINAIGEATGIDNLITKVILIAGGVGILAGVFSAVGAVVSAVGGVISGVFSVIAGAIGFIAAAGWPVVAAIAAIAAAIYFVKNNWDAVMAAFSPGLEKMEQGLAFLADAWERMQPVIEALIPPLSAVAEAIGGLIVDAIANFFNMAGYAFRAVGGLIDFIATLLQGLFNIGVWVFNGLTSLINTVASALQKVGEFIQWCADGLAGLINKAKDFLGMGGQISAEGSALERFANQVIPTGNSYSNTNNYKFTNTSVEDGIRIINGTNFSPYG